jgi:ABC-type nitrate/sulfonate/bicarbonate transport system permease component
LNKGFFEYWFESIITLTESLAIAFVFSLVIAHLGTIALFRPMSKLIASFRVVSMAPLMTWCAFLGIIGHTRTTGLMVFLITCYSVPSFLQIFNAIGEDELDYYKTLRCGPAMTWWQTTVRARMPIVIATYIINMGMAIHMIPYMEALDKASGGLGVLLSAGERDLNFPEIMAGTILLWMSGLLIFKVMVIATSAIWPKAWSKLTGGK